MYGINKAQGSWDHNHLGFFKNFVFVIEFDDSETKLLISLWLWHIIHLWLIFRSSIGSYIFSME